MEARPSLYRTPRDWQEVLAYVEEHQSIWVQTFFGPYICRAGVSGTMIQLEMPAAIRLPRHLGPDDIQRLLLPR